MSKAWPEYEGHGLGYAVFAHTCPGGCARCRSPYKCSCWCTICIIHLGGMTDGETPCPDCGRA